MFFCVLKGIEAKKHLKWTNEQTTFFFQSSSCPVCSKSTFEIYDNTKVSAAILSPVVCFSDVMKTAGMCSKGARDNVTGQCCCIFCPLLVKNDTTRLCP